MTPPFSWLLRVVLLLAVLATVAVPAQTRVHAVHHWTTRDGLPQNTITHMASGPDGSLYITTFGGMVRFDGREFELFDLSTTPVLGTSRMSSIAVDGTDTLFVATFEGQLVRKRGRTWQLIDLPDLQSQEIYALAFAPNGALWIATQAGLFKLDINGTIATKIVEGTFSSLTIDPQGVVYACRGNSTEMIRVEHGHTKTMPGLPPLTDRWVRSLECDQQSRVYCASGEKLLRSTETGWESIPVEVGLIMDLQISPTGGLFVLGARSLVYWKDNAVLWVESAETLGLPPRESLRSLHFDGNGNTWIGSNTMGLFQFSPSPIGALVPPDGKQQYTKAVAVNERGEIFGMGEYLWKINNKKLEAVADFQPFSITASANGGLWLHDHLGIHFRLDDKSMLAIGSDDLPDIPGPMLEATDGSLWFAGDQFLVNWRHGKLSSIELVKYAPTRLPETLFQDSQGRIWLGRHGDIMIWDGEQMQVLVSGVDLPVGAVREIFEDSSGNMWIGTYGAGLFRIRDDQIAQITTDQGLFENFATAIAPDNEGRIVILGNRAVTSYSLATLNAVADGQATKVYGQTFNSGPGIDLFEGNAAGLQNCAKDSDGTIWFPTMHGLAWFDPRAMPPLPKPPVCRVDFELPIGARSETLPNGDTACVLAPGGRYINISFTAPSFRLPRQVHYRYRLAGLDEKWHEIDRETGVAYADLQPGDYTFEIQASVADGKFGPLNQNLRLKIPKTLAEGNAFRVLLTLVGVLGVVYWAFARSRNAGARQLELEAMVVERTGELQREIAERERAEQDLRTASEELEHKVSNRTSDLAEALTSLEWDMNQREILEGRLRESEKLESVGRLAGGLAHDFNNILTAILGEIDLAKSGLETGADNGAPIREHLSNARDAGLRAAHITRQLLAYSRQQQLTPQVLDPLKSLHDLRPPLQRLVSRNIAISIDPSSKSLPVLIDPAQFEQVLINLVVNAAEAMPKGGSITLSTRIVGDRDQRLTCVISVKDTGEGLSVEERKRIFEPFFTTKGKGRGLGLASVQGIIFQSNGTMQVESEPDLGTVFHVVLPITDHEPASPEPLSNVPSLAGLTVLLVDDEDTVRRVTHKMLAQAGINVIATGDPLLAIDLAREHEGQLDLLLSDVVMNQLNGKQLGEAVCELHPETRLLFISAYSFDLLADRKLVDKHTELLPKPFNAAGLLARISKVIGAKVAR